MTDVTALRALQPALEQAEDRLPDEILARLWCAIKGLEFACTDTYAGCFGFVTKDEKLHGIAPRDRCPDVDLTAADKLVAELNGKRFSGMALKGAVFFACVQIGTSEIGKGEHVSSEPMAIMIALTKALIAAEQEQEQEHA